MQIESVPFVVHRRPYCVWDVELRERVLSFLGQLQPDYFGSQADVHEVALDGEEKQLAAVSLRNLYFHGMESLFALIGALLQAPTAVPAWLLRYRNRELRELVADVTNGRLQFTRFVDGPVTWERVSKAVHSNYVGEAMSTDEVIAGFARLWHRLAQEHLDDNLQAEYNSLKHGFRVNPGGFHMAIGLETVVGQPAPPENMRSMGGSDFGTEFFVVEPLSDDASNFRIRRRHHNWYPANLSIAIKLMAMSMHNVISYLRFLNGAETHDLTHQVPYEESAFDQPWRTLPMTTSSSLDYNLEASMINPMTKDTVLESFREEDEGEA